MRGTGPASATFAWPMVIASGYAPARLGTSAEPALRGLFRRTIFECPNVALWPILSKKDFEGSSRNIDSRRASNAQDRFKNPACAILLLRVVRVAPTFSTASAPRRRVLDRSGVPKTAASGPAGAGRVTVDAPALPSRGGRRIRYDHAQLDVPVQLRPVGPESLAGRPRYSGATRFGHHAQASHLEPGC